MNLRQIEMFCAVMRCRTTVAAAHELNVSQPAISNAIRHIEAQLRMMLFERIGSRLVPTLEAQALYQDLEPLQTMAQAVTEKIRDLQDTKRGHIRILATHAVGRPIVAKALSTFLEKRKDVHVFFDVRRMEGVIESVESGFADLAVALAPVPRPGMHIEPVLDARMVVALPRRHRLAKKRSLSAHDLQKERIIGLERGSGLGSIIRQAFDDAGAAYSPTVEVRHGSTACMLVELGAGIAVVDEFSAGAENQWKIDLRRFDPEIVLPVSIMYLKERRASRLVSQLIQELRKTRR